jgi:hypothetical protein
MFPINLVLFQWRLIFDTKLKKLRYLFSDLKLLTLKKSGSVRLNEHTQLGSSVRCFTGPGWSGRWWRLKRSSTNWSFFSKWFWNWLDSAQLSCRDSFASSSRSQFQLDQLIKTPFGLGPDFVSGIVSSIEPRISTCLLNMNLNKGRD